MLAYEIHNLLKKLAIPMNMWRYRFTIRHLITNYFHLIPMHKQKNLGKKKLQKSEEILLLESKCLDNITNQSSEFRLLAYTNRHSS